MDVCVNDMIKKKIVFFHQLISGDLGACIHTHRRAKVKKGTGGLLHPVLCQFCLSAYLLLEG